MSSSAHQPRQIEIRLQTLSQLFNSMDPSPFHERDLDPAASEFILSWAQEHHVRTPLRLVVHLAQVPEQAQADVESLVANSIHHYFRYQELLTRRALRHLMRDGWISLLIGLTFLGVCSLAAQQLAPQLPGGGRLLEEGLTIIGWVAMWRPVDIYLYRWWPLHRLGRYHRKLAEIPVKVRLSGARAVQS
jgi:hypothetical protein